MLDCITDQKTDKIHKLKKIERLRGFPKTQSGEIQDKEKKFVDLTKTGRKEV